MKVWLSASPKHAQDARQWVLLLPLTFRRDLDSAICELEQYLGGCDVYVEAAIDLPRGHRNVRHSQIDLLLCFERCVVACEIKGHSDLSDKLNAYALQKATEQLEAHQDIIQAWIGRHGKAYPVLFCPNAAEPALQKISGRFADTGHQDIRAAGAHSALREARSADSGHPFYLPEVIRQVRGRYEGWARQLRVPSQAASTIAVKAAMTGSGKRYEHFTSMSALGTYLASLRRDARTTLRPGWHLAELRLEESERAYRTLHDHGVVEVVGAPGVGKSSVIQDLIDRWVRDGSTPDVQRVSLNDCHGPLQLKSALLAQLEGQAPGAIEIEEAFERLLATERVLWVEQVDDPSRSAVSELLRTIGGRVDRPALRWIVESHRPLLPTVYRTVLKGLSAGAIHRILELAPRGAASLTAEEVVQRSNGLPRVAMYLWAAESNDGSAADGESVQWFTRKLSQDEGRIASAIGRLISIAPLGMPESTLSKWAAHACPDLSPAKIRNATTSLLMKLGDDQLAHLEDTRSVVLGALASEATGSESGLGMLLMSIDQAALKQFAAAEGIVADAEAYLSDTHLGNDDLIAVTLSLNLPELEPFLRSTFRRSRLPEVMSWLERRGVVQVLAQKSDQAAAYRCLTALLGIVSGERVSTSEVLERIAFPRAGSALEHYAATVVEGVALGHDRDVTGSTLSDWRRRAESESDRDLRCEMMVRLATALAGQDQHQAGSAVLHEALELTDIGDGTRALVLSHALGELNRKKVLSSPTNMEGHARTRTAFATELFALGVRVGDATVCADAVFFFERANVHHLGRSKPLDEDVTNKLLAILPSFEFVERVGRTRRAPALLTQGSIHRYIGRWQQVPLARFLPHAADAIQLYQRVLRITLPRRAIRTALEATSYMIDVCVKLLRFDPDSLALASIMANLRLVCVEARLALQAVADGPFMQEDRKLYCMIVHNLPTLQLTVAIYDNDAVIAANIDFQCATHGVDELIRTQASSGTKVLKDYFVTLNRALRFALRYNPEGFGAILPGVRSGLIDASHVKSRIVADSRDKDLRQYAAKFEKLVSA